MSTCKYNLSGSFTFLMSVNLGELLKTSKVFFVYIFFCLLTFSLMNFDHTVLKVRITPLLLNDVVILKSDN